MPHLRVLVVAASTGLCLLGSGLLGAGMPAAYAATPGSGPLVRATTGTPWKHHVRTYRTAGTLTRTPAATVADPDVAFAQRIGELVNDARASAGLPPLAVSTCATDFATSWSRHMASTGDFSHQSLTPLLDTCAARAAGENIAYGATSPEQFMSLWMNSSGHRANILRTGFTDLGVAVARSAGGTVYATQDFLTR